MPKTCIIGAGITGLATAWQLKRLGQHCLVLETSNRVGGSIRSIQKDGFIAEEGPNSIQLNSATIADFLDTIPGLKEQTVEAEPTANKRYIVRNGKPQAVPMNPLSAVTTPLWSMAGKLRVLKEPLIRPIAEDVEESVADFVRRRLGKELYTYAINPLVGGIYAGNPEQLSLRYGFPKLYALEQQHGGLIRGAIAKARIARKASEPKFRKRIISFKHGLEALPATIAKALGDAVQTGVSIKSIQYEDNKWHIAWDSQIESFDRLILTIPAHALSKLPFEQSIQREFDRFNQINYPPVSVLSLGYKRSQIRHPLDGFGALVPECEGRRILGVLFPSSIFADRAPKDEVLLTVFIGGERNPEYATPETEALMGSVQPEIESLLGIEGAPTFVHHKHWPQAIPQYKLGYGKYLEAMKAIEVQHPGLKLAGNYRTGISLTYCLEAALSY